MIKNQEKMVKLLKVLFPDAKIILFGSRARGDAQPTSDVDIALDNGEKIHRLELAQASNVIEALNIPHKIDLVDYRSVPELMQRMIDRDGVLWSD
jgi:predicted nucleotidyltransferase